MAETAAVDEIAQREDLARCYAGMALGELAEATRKFAAFPTVHHGAAVIREELDELWDAVKANDLEQARQEAIQVAAMAIRFLVDTDTWRPVK